METKPSANHLTAVAILAQSEFRNNLSVKEGSLEQIQEAVKLFGGTISLSKINDQTESTNVLISSYSEIGNCQLFVHVFTTKLAIMLQKDAFQSDCAIFQKGTDLTIIDNQYLVLSDAS